MIVYESNKNFLRDITHLTRSWTMQRVIRAALGVGAVTAMITVAFEEIWPMEISVPSSIFSLLGIVLSILLVFRTNTAYDRWWEGRKQWGALVNNCRNLAVAVQTTLPPEEVKARFEIAVLISNFCITLREHLRTGAKVEELIFVSHDEIEKYRQRTHLPSYISSQIHQKVQDYYRSGTITGADIRNMKPHLQALLDIAGACERIKKTPIPFSYSVYIKLLILGYSLMLPFGLIRDFGYFTIPLVTFIFFTFIGIEMMAAEIEDPFGLDCNDLPTGDIAHTIRNNVFEILEVTHVHQPEREEKLYQKIF